MSGILLVVATPIGNLADLTPRAADALRRANLVLAEDTRRTRGLLAHLGIHTPLESFDAHRERGGSARVVERIRAGQTVALVTDAGTPGLSDPGGLLVRAVRAAGLPVSPLPRPSAAAAAVSVAGLDDGRFRFEGFLPRKGSERERRLATIRDADVAVVFFESPQRLGRTLRDLADVAGKEREAIVCRELTKLHEEIASGTLESLAVRFADDVLGELTIVLLPDPSRADRQAGPAAPDPAALAARLRDEDLAPSRVARILEDVCDLGHNEAYRIAHGKPPQP